MLTVHSRNPSCVHRRTFFGEFAQMVRMVVIGVAAVKVPGLMDACPIGNFVVGK
jgi:hypothetical protein